MLGRGSVMRHHICFRRVFYLLEPLSSLGSAWAEVAMGLGALPALVPGGDVLVLPPGKCKTPLPHRGGEGKPRRGREAALSVLGRPSLSGRSRWWGGPARVEDMVL